MDAKGKREAWQSGEPRKVVRAHGTERTHKEVQPHRAAERQVAGDMDRQSPHTVRKKHKDTRATGPEMVGPLKFLGKGLNKAGVYLVTNR